MIPVTGWRDMDSAPQDGTIIIVLHREFNKSQGKPRIQPAQWLCDHQGENPTWRMPWKMDAPVFADKWMPVKDLLTQTSEFDL
jgi:hypothetical protein